MTQEYVRAARTSELSPGEKKVVPLGDERVLLVNVDGDYYAVQEECTHAYALLSLGQLYGDEVLCPLHGSTFRVTDGEVLSPPATEGLTVYPVRVEGNDVLIGPLKP